MDIDASTGKIYWASNGDNCIKRANTNGTGVETIVTGVTYAIGLGLNYNPHTLPVELTEFTACYSNDLDEESVFIQWETASETDVAGYNIFRADEENVLIAGEAINSSMILAAGTTTDPQQYEFYNICSDVYHTQYYWLEVINLDYTNALHGPIQYTPGDTDGDNQPDIYLTSTLGECYPNPVKTKTEISYQIRGSRNAQNAGIKIYNILGGFVKLVQGTDGTATIKTSDLSNGIYFYVLQTENSYDVKRFVVFK